MTVAQKKTRTRVVSMLHARENLGKLLDRVDSEGRSLVIEKRGSPKAILLSLDEYVRLAAPEPEVLRLIGEESVVNGTDKLTADEIDDIIHEARGARNRR